MDIRTNTACYTYPHSNRLQIPVASFSDIEDYDDGAKDQRLFAHLDSGNSDQLVKYLNNRKNKGLFLCGAVEDRHFETLIKALADPALKIREVAICNSDMGNEKVLRVIDTVIANTSLHIESFGLENCGLDSKGAQEVVQRLKHYGPMTHLSMAACQVDSNCVPDLLLLLSHHRLHYLNLFANHLGPVAHMRILGCVNGQETTVHLSEKKLLHRYGKNQLKFLDEAIKKEVLEKRHIRLFLRTDALPSNNDDDEILDIALFCAEHEPHALRWLYELLEIANKIVLRPSKEFMHENAKRFSTWQAASADGLFFVRFDDSSAGCTVTPLSEPVIDTSKPASGWHIHFNGPDLEGTPLDQQDICIFVLAAFPDRGADITDAVALDAALVLKATPEKHKEAVAAMWEAVHRKWVESIALNMDIRRNTAIYGVPLDLQGKILADIVSRYSITQAAALHCNLSALMDTARLVAEVEIQRKQLRILYAKAIEQPQPEEKVIDSDEEFVDAAPLAQDANANDGKKTRKREFSDVDARNGNDAGVKSSTKKIKPEQPVDYTMRAPQ